MSTEKQIKLFAIAESSGQYQSSHDVSPEWDPSFSSGERGTPPDSGGVVHDSAAIAVT